MNEISLKFASCKNNTFIAKDIKEPIIINDYI